MKLVKDWRRIAAYSLSFWMQLLGIMSMIVPEIKFLTTGQDSDPYFLWWIGILLLIAGTLGRIFQQGTNPKWEWLRLSAVVVAITLLAVLATSQAYAQATEKQTMDVAVPFVGGWEGKRNRAYLDTIANPPVWTVCYGETRGVGPNDYKTDVQCLGMLRAGLAEFRGKLHTYFSVFTKADRLTPERDTAYLSLAWNAGVGGIGKSTAVRRLNAGDIAGGCTALTWWNKAGGRVIRGLVNRRTAEAKLCRKGLG